MSSKIFKKVKKQNGERFAKVIRDYHNGIFEIPDILSVVKHAGRGAEDAENILSYLLSLMQQDDDVNKVSGDPYALLDEAGYHAYLADTREKQDSIRQYFSPGEELCTFGTDRYKSYYIINAVRKDVDSIIRKDFKGVEERDDRYGTSVMSIQVAKKGGFISIKNRYNHVVPGCDNTLNSNPDNIINGLSRAIQETFRVSFKSSNSLPNTHILVDNQVFRVRMEVNGIYYGDTAYVKDGTLFEVDSRQQEYLFDIYIYNDRTKTFRLVDNSVRDCFPEDMNRYYAGKKSLYVKDYCIWDVDENGEHFIMLGT